MEHTPCGGDFPPDHRRVVPGVVTRVSDSDSMCAFSVFPGKVLGKARISKAVLTMVQK